MFRTRLWGLVAVLTVFLFPLLLTRWCTQTVLPLLAITSLMDAAITWFYWIETKGLDLERLH